MPIYKVGRGRRGRAATKQPTGGVGTELKAMLLWTSYLVPEGKKCGCEARAAEMDRLGLVWCDENRETIIGWLKLGAAELELPFEEHVARWALNIAINRARSKEPKG